MVCLVCPTADSPSHRCGAQVTSACSSFTASNDVYHAGCQSPSLLLSHASSRHIARAYMHAEPLGTHHISTTDANLRRSSHPNTCATHSPLLHEPSPSTSPQQDSSTSPQQDIMHQPLFTRVESNSYYHTCAISLGTHVHHASITHAGSFSPHLTAHH